MSREIPPTLINWVQLNDLLGNDANADQRRVLSRLWRDLRVSLFGDLAKLENIEAEADLRRALHGLRGLVSMWGLAELASRMRECEKGENTRTVWLRDKAEFRSILKQSVAEIDQRFPDLVSAN